MRQGFRLLIVSAVLPAVLAGCGAGRNIGKAATADQLIQAGLIQLNAGKQEAALATFRQAAAKQPTNVFAYYNIGVVLQQQGKNVEALAAYGQALVAKPDYVPAMFNSAVIYGATDPNLAIATYRRIIKLQPQAPTAYLNLGLLEAAGGQEAQARKDLAKAVEEDGTLVNAIPKNVFDAKRAKPAASPSPSPTPTG